MNPESLAKRCTVVLLLALSLATLAGLLAWGPVSLSEHAHEYADTRRFRGLPNAMDLLTHIPVIAVGVWGWWRIRSLDAEPHIKRPWSWFFLASIASGVMGSVYHWAPSDARFVLSQMPRSASCALLVLVFLAERVDGRWGSRPVVTGVIPAVIGGALWWWATDAARGAGDLRPLLWIGLLPLLLVLAGTWHLPGSRVGGRDWLLALIVFALAHVLQAVDQPVMRATHGWVSGHTLHHLALAACIGWLAYCADVPVRARAKAASAPASASSSEDAAAEEASGDSVQPSTS